jgi:hypothetical protein
MQWYTNKVISLEHALYYSSNPTEFQLQVEGIAAASDRTFEGFEEKGGGVGGNLGSKRSERPKPGPGREPGGSGDAVPGSQESGVQGLSRDPLQR